MTETAIRNADLRNMLNARRLEMKDDVQSRVHCGRTDKSNEVRDAVEMSDADIQADIEVALLQMRAEAVVRIDHALSRLDADEYGSCVDCNGEISERRLRALPFAVRCKACEERREQGQRYAKQAAKRRSGLSLFPDVAGF